MFPPTDCATAQDAVTAAGNSVRPAVDAVVTALRSSPYVPLRSIACSERRGVLKLQGCVPSYYLKQLAQSLVRGINNSWLVQNEIQVVSPGDRFSLRGASFGSNLSEPRRPR